MCVRSELETMAALAVGYGIENIVRCLQLAAVAVAESVFVGVDLLAALAVVGSQAIAGGCGDEGCGVSLANFVADVRLEDGQSFDGAGFAVLKFLIDG